MLTTLIVTVCLNADMNEGCKETTHAAQMNRNRCEFTGVMEVNKLYRKKQMFTTFRCEDVPSSPAKKR
jgi:hypothetical protein